MSPIRDTSPQHRREYTLPQSDQYYQHLIQNLPNGVLIQSPSGEILLSNRTAEQLLGLTEGQLRGRIFTELEIEIAVESGDSSAETTQAVYRAMTAGHPVQNLILRVRPSKADFRIWLLVSIMPEKDIQGLTQYVVVTLSDITDFKNAEAALSTSEEQYQSLVDSVQEVIFWIDIDDLWVFLNPAWQQITGYLLPESVGHHWLDCVSPPDYDRVRDSFMRVKHERLSEYRETFRLRTTDNRFCWVELHARLVYSKDDVFTGMSGTLSDITERKLNEENTIRLAVQERSIEIQRQLLAGLSHDIRTPLSIISTSAYLGQHQSTNPDKRQGYLITIAEQIDLLTRMIERISMVAKLTIGDIPFNFVKTQLNNLIQQVMVKRQQTVQVNQVSLRLQLDPGLSPIRADEYWMMEMIDNLLINAIENTPPNGEICLTTSVCSTGVMLQLSDTGTGIALDILPNIFDPFYKADKARSNPGYSAGLGLTIVGQVVNRHGGHIEVESEIGRGTTFRIFLPLPAEDLADSVRTGQWFVSHDADLK